MGYLETQWQRGRKIYGKRSWRNTTHVSFIQCALSAINEEIEALESYFARYT